MDELKPCPVCRRIPKIHYFGVNSAYVKCKPLFRKTHLIAEVAYAPPSMLSEAAIKAWNRAVEYAIRKNRR